MYLSYFATAEEAALCIARPPEGRAAAERAVPVVPQLSEEETEQGQGPAYATRRILSSRTSVPSDTVVKEEGAIPSVRYVRFTWTLRRLAFRGSKGAVCFGGE